MSRARAIPLQRQATHGPFVDAARIKRRLVGVVEEEMTRCGKARFSPDEDLDAAIAEGIAMALGKVARMVAGDPLHVDHADDIAGYGTLIGDAVRAARRRAAVARGAETRKRRRTVR